MRVFALLVCGFLAFGTAHAALNDLPTLIERAAMRVHASAPGAALAVLAAAAVHALFWGLRRPALPALARRVGLVALAGVAVLMLVRIQATGSLVAVAVLMGAAVLGAAMRYLRDRTRTPVPYLADSAEGLLVGALLVAASLPHPWVFVGTWLLLTLVRPLRWLPPFRKDRA